MAEKVFMIALSPTMEEGRIAAWKVKEGDAVKNGTVLCEVETDKAVMEYESPASGTVLKILLEAGRTAKIGDLIAVVGKPGENIASLLGAAPQKDAAASPAAAVSVVASDLPAAPVAQPAESKPSAPAEPAEPKATAQALAGYPKSSPLARKVAREKGLDLRALRGSGPEGRVVKRDVDKAASAGSVQAASAAGNFGLDQGPAGGGRPVLGDRLIPVSPMRAAIAKRLAESAFQAPHFFLRTAVTLDALLDARGRLNAEANPKVSLNAFFLKFSAEAIKRHPMINSTWKGSSIELHGSVDIGLAVALQEGLVTPVVRDCGRKGILEIDRELATLVDRARKGGLKPEEYTGATFSISNLGTYGIEEFTAIINPPGSAILALGAVTKEPVVGENEEILVRRRMRLTLSCDHRTIDGAVGAAFLKDLAVMLEDPVRALV